jgi:NAD(P)-dependent dehydrogenase (short-subunit alcohol dehydrogenase family)
MKRVKLIAIIKKFYEIKKKREQRLSRIPLNRYGNKDELCGALIYFIFNASSYITDQDLYVDSGLLHKRI